MIHVEPGVPSGRLCLYVNGADDEFPVERVAFTARIQHPSLTGPIHVALSPWGQHALGAEGGVLAIAGFNARTPPDAEAEFLFLQGP